MQGFQLDDNCVGPIFRAIEANEKLSKDLAKGQSLEYCWLLQQWDQLLVHNRILCRCYVQPTSGATWEQLVISKTLHNEVLRETHEGVCGGHLGH